MTWASRSPNWKSRPANRWQSAEQSSLDAWLEKYPLYNRPEYSVSYYTKGQVLGELLDILIRDRTDNEKSLDDVLRAMNTEFAQAGKNYRDSVDVQATAEKIAGGSFEDFFKRYVAGADRFLIRRPQTRGPGLARDAAQARCAGFCRGECERSADRAQGRRQRHCGSSRPAKRRRHREMEWRRPAATCRAVAARTEGG